MIDQTADTGNSIRIRFDSHGLGDCVHAAMALQLYRQRDYRVQVQIERNKQFIWQVAGIDCQFDGDFPSHGYPYRPSLSSFFALDLPDHSSNKVAGFFDHPALPSLGTKEEVWQELTQVRLSAHGHIPSMAHAEAEEFLKDLPRPVIALHSKGSNWQAEKSIPDGVAFELILELLRRTTGSVVVLDYDERAPMVGSARCKGIKPSWGHIGIDRLCALLERTDLLIGVDSGPFHVANLVDVPALGVFLKIPPVRCCLPNDRATYMVSASDRKHWKQREQHWRFAYYQSQQPTAVEIADVAEQILGGYSCQPLSLTQVANMAGMYDYRRVGYDQRGMELLPDGRIGMGAAGCECCWRPEAIQQGWGIVILGEDQRPTCHLRRCSDGILRGRWLDHERMAVELVPACQSGRNDESIPADHQLKAPAEAVPSNSPEPPKSYDTILHQGVWVRTGPYHRQDLDVLNEVLERDAYRLQLRSHYGAEEVVVDIGAHIGTFAVAWHRKNPAARIVCVEACPENIAVLQKNVGHFATVIQAACSYEPGELALLNSVMPNGTATGGSTVVSKELLLSAQPFGHQYWRDIRPLSKLTLEQILEQAGVDHLDVLKLDCEGSEFSILDQSPTIDSVRFILGEYHGQARWDSLREKRFVGWNYGHMHAAGDLGIFHLENRHRSVSPIRRCS